MTYTSSNTTPVKPPIDLLDRRYFVVIGAMKAGTTSLARYFAQHPQVFLTTPKEPQFFSRDFVYERGMDWYLSLFAGAKGDHVFGEASTCYSRQLAYPLAPERMHRHAPHARLVYVLRHPVERLYSHYVASMEWLVRNRASLAAFKERAVRDDAALDPRNDSSHAPPCLRSAGETQRARLARHGAGMTTFEEWAALDDEAMDASDYALQIDRYLRFYGAGQLHCVLHDDLFNAGASAEVVERLCEFIGVRTDSAVGLSGIHENPRGQRFANRRVQTTLTTIRNRAPAKQIVDACPARVRRSLRRAAGSVLSNSAYGRRHARRFLQSIPLLSDDTRRALCRHFLPSVVRLEERLGRRLPAWRE